MPKRLAITIAGAVSLGSYEAGVLSEILTAIKANNTNPQTTEDEKVYIDVLTGASAGGMSAAILAQKLLLEADTLDDPASNSLHSPWVVDISLSGLLNLTAKDNSTHSVLSSDLIETISKKYLTARFDQGTPPAPITHASIDVTKPLKLGLALSNLDGVDYGQDLLTGGSFVYTRYQDQFITEYALSTNGNSSAEWEKVRNVAVACGAFPFAFAIKALQRTLKDYLVPAAKGFPQLNFRFAYTDGGVFQNEPLGMAKNFVDQIDNHLDTENRFYLFIAPGARDSTISKNPLTDATANFFATTGALVGAIFNQARFHDWITAEDVNKSVTLFNQRALELKDVILSGAVAAATIKPAATALLGAFQRTNPRLTQAFVSGELQRLKTQFHAEYRALEASAVPAGSAEAWLEAVYVFELAAELPTYDEMNIYGITALDTELAGSPLFAFAGFFDQRIRQHDFDVGRNKAKEFLRAQNLPGVKGLGPLRYNPGAPIPIDPSLNDFDVTKLSASERQQLRDRLLDRGDTLLQEADVSAPIRWAIKAFYIKKKLDAWLGL